MRERWQRIPIRWKAAGALLLVLGLLVGLWGSLGWSWPTRELAFRMAERARAFGPGEIVAQGELTYEHDWDGAPKGWMVSRSGDAFLVLDLYRRWGLWTAEPYLGGGEAWTAEGSAPLGSVLLADGRYTSTAIEPEGDAFPWRERWTEEVAVLSGDPDIVRVEAYVSSRYFFHNGDWEARREMEVQSPVVEARPVGEGVYLASIPCEEPPETQEYNSWSRSSTTVVRGYDAAGTLVYDSSDSAR